VKQRLPFSSTGSEQALRAAFMDAMAVTDHFRKPNLFITKTTNPNWPEISMVHDLLD
jgi:Helitron helicase-like domain at N-terminus